MPARKDREQSVRGLQHRGNGPWEKGQHICPGAESSGVGSKVIQNLWQGSRVRLWLDNMTAVAQILKMGSPRSQRCFIMTQEIWECVLYHGNTITAQYMPGKAGVGGWILRYSRLPWGCSCSSRSICLQTASTTSWLVSGAGDQKMFCFIMFITIQVVSE